MRLGVKSLADWHYWFAWHPVKIGDQWVWLEWVEARRLFMGRKPIWEFKLFDRVIGPWDGPQ